MLSNWFRIFVNVAFQRRRYQQLSHNSQYFLEISQESAGSISQESGGSISQESGGSISGGNIKQHKCYLIGPQFW